MKINTSPQSGSLPDNRRGFLSISSVALLIPATLLACGGAGNDDPPIVSLYATISSGSVGALFSLFAEAEANDDSAIKEVSFYRITSNSEILLATYAGKPYLLQTTIPDGTAGTTIEYLARAKDTDDQTADSSKVSITVNA
jgi:hypothetical protein